MENLGPLEGRNLGSLPTWEHLLTFYLAPYPLTGKLSGAGDRAGDPCPPPFFDVAPHTTRPREFPMVVPAFYKQCLSSCLPGQPSV